MRWQARPKHRSSLDSTAVSIVVDITNISTNIETAVCCLLLLPFSHIFLEANVLRWDWDDWELCKWPKASVPLTAYLTFVNFGTPPHYLGL